MFGLNRLGHVLPPEVALHPFYVAPLALVAWSAGTPCGVVLAALAAVAWTEADTAGRAYGSAWLAGWNAAVHLAGFTGTAVVAGLLRGALDDARSIARTDALTGARNRLSFRESAAAATGAPTPCTLVYIDVDGFKAVNDHRGHAAGDLLLRRIAATLRHVVRERDVVARLGGDEFGVLLPGTDEVGASTVLDRVRAGLADLTQSEGWPVTFSIGAVTVPGGTRDVDRLMNRADEEMYRAKHEGKDRVVHRVIG